MYPALHSNFLNRWRVRIAPCIFSLVVLAPGLTLQAQATDFLSPSERAWLAAHPQIRLAIEANYPPFVFTDAEGAAQGLSIDYIRTVEDQLGIQFQVLPAAPLNRILPALQRGEVDLHPALQETPERDVYLNFSHPYAHIHAVLVTSTAGTSATPLATLRGQKVAVSDGYAVQSYLTQHFPEIALIPLPDDERCLEQVRTGAVAAAVVDVASALWLIRQHGWSDLHIGADVGFTYNLRLASRRDLPELNAILDKALASIPVEERAAILSRWVEDQANAPDDSWIWITLSMLLASLGGALLFLRRPPRRS